jgi:hypothetical protein
MKLSLIVLSVLALSSAQALAEKPANPGGFGNDRAAYIHSDLAKGSDEAPGASEVGKILSGRAGDNGAINNDYKCSHGDVPSTASICQ